MYYKLHQESENPPNQEPTKKYIMILELMKTPRTNSTKLQLPTTFSIKKMEILNKTLNSGKEKLVMPNKKKLPNSKQKMTNTELPLLLLNKLMITKMLFTKLKLTDLKDTLKTNKTKSVD